MKKQKIIEKAKAKYLKLLRVKRNPLVQETLGKFVFRGLLHHPNLLPVPGPIELEGALTAGEVEPRVLELLPALIVKKPKWVRGVENMPDDLREVLFDLRRGKATKVFRGVAARDYTKWIPHLGHQKKTGHFIKTFRFRSNDEQLLQSLKTDPSEPDISVVRRALLRLKS